MKLAEKWNKLKYNIVRVKAKWRKDILVLDKLRKYEEDIDEAQSNMDTTKQELETAKNEREENCKEKRVGIERDFVVTPGGFRPFGLKFITEYSICDDCKNGANCVLRKKCKTAQNKFAEAQGQYDAKVGTLNAFVNDKFWRCR